MKTPPLFDRNSLKTLLSAAAIFIFAISILLFFGFHKLSGIPFFIFGITVMLSGLVLATRDVQHYPSWLSKVLESIVILSLASAGFVNYYLQSEIPISRPILWISALLIIVAIIHAINKFIRTPSGKIIPVCFLVLIVCGGIIISVNGQPSAEKKSAPPGDTLRYRFDSGDRFIYMINSANENQGLSIPILVKEVVTSNSTTNFTLDVISTETSAGSTTEKRNLLTLTPEGAVIESISDTPIFTAMQRDLPNVIPYPKKIGNIPWNNTVEKTGSYILKGNNVNYSAKGVSNSSYIGRKQVSVPAGSFDCIGIHDIVNLSFNETISMPNGTVLTVTAVNAVGESWIDAEKGFLVSSSYMIDKKYDIDLTEIYRQMGFRALKREIPTRIIQNTELIENH